MICQWCHHETKTLDICEWCKRPLKGSKKKAQPTPGEAHLRAKALAKVKKNDRLLIYSMLGVVVLTSLVVAYTVVAQPPEAEELPGYLGIQKWRDRPQKDVKTTPEVGDDKAEGTSGEAVQTEKPTEPVDPDTPVSSQDEDSKTPTPPDGVDQPDGTGGEPDATGGEPAPEPEPVPPTEESGY